MADKHREPPVEDGSHPVEEHPTGVPGPGWTAGQVIVLVLAALVLLGAIAWFGVLAR